MQCELKHTSLAEACAKLAEAEKEDSEDGAEPMDALIRPVVVALMAHGFPTSSSCEGHLGRELYPWVGMAVPAQNRTSGALLECIRTIREQVGALNLLLGEFYELRGKPKGIIPWSEQLVAGGDGFNLDDSDYNIIDYLSMQHLRHVGTSGLPSWLGYDLKCRDADTLNFMPREVLAPHEEQILDHRQQSMLDFGMFLISKL